MKVLTIRQPWASLIIKGVKEYEFRSWKTNYRGKILIHAGLGVDKEPCIRLKEYLKEELPKGKIIGSAVITDCIKVDKKFKEDRMKENSKVYATSPYDEAYAWKLENVQVFENPIEAKGKLGLWNYENIDIM